MKLDEFLKQQPAGMEVAVHDNEYDTESYFYNDEPTDAWDQAMWKLASLLTVLESDDKPSVVVDLSELVKYVRSEIKLLADTFIHRHTLKDRLSEQLSERLRKVLKRLLSLHRDLMQTLVTRWLVGVETKVLLHVLFPNLKCLTHQILV